MSPKNTSGRSTADQNGDTGALDQLIIYCFILQKEIATTFEGFLLSL